MHVFLLHYNCTHLHLHELICELSYTDQDTLKWGCNKYDTIFYIQLVFIHVHPTMQVYTVCSYVFVYMQVMQVPPMIFKHVISTSPHLLLHSFHANLDDGSFLLWAGPIRSLVLLWWVQSDQHWGAVCHCTAASHHHEGQTSQGHYIQHTYTNGFDHGYTLHTMNLSGSAQQQHMFKSRPVIKRVVVKCVLQIVTSANIG